MSFPQFTHARYSHFVFVPIFLGQDKDFAPRRFLELLAELELSGTLMCIVPGGGPVDCLGGMIFVTAEGNIQFVEKEDLDSKSF